MLSELIQSDDDTLYEQVKQVYPDCYSCVGRIVEYFDRKFQVRITKEEQMYLMLHIGRVVNRERSRIAKENEN